jgi:hypothetical protein
MSQELTPAQRQEMFDLLLGELRRASDAASVSGYRTRRIADVTEHRSSRLVVPDVVDGKG